MVGGVASQMGISVLVDYSFVRIFRCSKAKVRSLLDQGHWVTILGSDSIECSQALCGASLSAWA